MWLCLVRFLIWLYNVVRFVVLYSANYKYSISCDCRHRGDIWLFGSALSALFCQNSRCADRGLIIVQLVMMFMGVQQTLVDFAVIVVFCGFIAYDFHRASVDTPTLVNAVYYSSELFLDIINVFIRVLPIFGRRN